MTACQIQPDSFGAGRIEMREITVFPTGTGGAMGRAGLDARKPTKSPLVSNSRRAGEPTS